MYNAAREDLNELIAEINPRLSEHDARRLALIICASMEGLTIFAGYRKPWNAELGAIKCISIDSFMAMIENTPSGEH